MVNKPLIRPYFWGGVALGGGGVARIPMIFGPCSVRSLVTSSKDILTFYLLSYDVCLPVGTYCSFIFRGDNPSRDGL